MVMTVNPFTQAGGAVNNGMSANQNPQARSPNGPNSGNTNSGTNPQGNTGNNDINNDPTNQLDPNAPKAPLKDGDEGYDPMMDFGKLWEDPVEDPNKPKPKKASYVPEIDQKVLTESVNKMDFTKNITPEMKQAMATGGEQGVQAMMDVINSSVRQATATIYQASNRMLAGSLERAENGFLEQVPSRVKNVMVDNSMGSNPIMSDPAYKPVIDATKERFLSRFPKATPDQVNKAVEGWLEDFVKKATKKTENKDTPTNADKLRTGADDGDWMEWAASETGVTR